MFLTKHFDEQLIQVKIMVISESRQVKMVSWTVLWFLLDIIYRRPYFLKAKKWFKFKIKIHINRNLVTNFIILSTTKNIADI